MGKSDKYFVEKYLGVPVDQNANGQYVIREGANPSYWRIGKHTKGKFTAPGQIFLTEKNIPIAIVQAEPLAFKDRHEVVALQRFTGESVSPAGKQWVLLTLSKRYGLGILAEWR